MNPWEWWLKTQDWFLWCGFKENVLLRTQLESSKGLYWIVTKFIISNFWTPKTTNSIFIFICFPQSSFSNAWTFRTWATPTNFLVISLHFAQKLCLQFGHGLIAKWRFWFCWNLALSFFYLKKMEEKKGESDLSFGPELIKWT